LRFASSSFLGEDTWTRLEEWDVATGAKTRAWTIPVVRGDILPSISSDERRLLVAGVGAGHVAVDLETGRVLESDELSTRGPTLSANGRLFAIPNSTGVTRIFDLEAGREVRRVRGFLQGAHTAAFSADLHRLVIGSGGFEALKIWDMASFEDLLTLQAEGTPSDDAVTAFSPSGNLLISVFGFKLHVWRAPTSEEIENAERKTPPNTLSLLPANP
jgi:WD40 repeat protein